MLNADMHAHVAGAGLPADGRGTSVRHAAATEKGEGEQEPAASPAKVDGGARHSASGWSHLPISTTRASSPLAHGE